MNSNNTFLNKQDNFIRMVLHLLPNLGNTKLVHVSQSRCFFYLLPMSLCPIPNNDNTRLTLSENKEPIKLLQNKHNVGNKLEQVP